jgi:hypothetical protein
VLFFLLYVLCACVSLFFVELLVLIVRLCFSLFVLSCWCWGPSASEGPQKHDLTMSLEYNVWTGIFELEPTV